MQQIYYIFQTFFLFHGISYRFFNNYPFYTHGTHRHHPEEYAGLIAVIKITNFGYLANLEVARSAVLRLFQCLGNFGGRDEIIYEGIAEHDIHFILIDKDHFAH